MPGLIAPPKRPGSLSFRVHMREAARLKGPPLRESMPLDRDEKLVRGGRQDVFLRQTEPHAARPGNFHRRHVRRVIQIGGADPRVTQSQALENLGAAHPAASENSASGCHDSSRTDEASRPVGGHVAVLCPVPGRLEDHPRTSNTANHIIWNRRTGGCWTSDENSSEIARSIDPQHLDGILGIMR
jgi:hypothetical protein